VIDTLGHVGGTVVVNGRPPFPKGVSGSARFLNRGGEFAFQRSPDKFAEGHLLLAGSGDGAFLEFGGHNNRRPVGHNYVCIIA